MPVRTVDNGNGTCSYDNLIINLMTARTGTESGLQSSHAGVTGHHRNRKRGLHCKDNIPKIRSIFPEKDLYIHVSVCDLCIPTIGLHILLQENRRTDRGNILYKSLTDT
jgi:hypothetical protein